MHIHLSWKMKIAVILSVCWFSFWTYAGWVEESLVFGLIFGAFPLIVIWWLWAGLKSPKKDKESEFVAYLKEVNKINFDEKRKYDRLEYPPDRRPCFTFDGHRMDIINISEKGLKLLNEDEVEMTQFMNGEAELLCGKKISVDGQVSWSLNKEVGLLITNIPEELIVEERDILTTNYPEAMKLQ